MDGAGHPIHAAQLVEDGAPDAQARIGLEGGAGAGIVIPDRVEQPGKADAVKLFTIHVRRQSHGETADNSPHERNIALDQLSLHGTAGT